ncbi:MAG: hypothetical protein LBK06_09900 [Planctomycetaceae bacterium]|nr:hypothetical protein [Planctomycetaceae bacterium]
MKRLFKGEAYCLTGYGIKTKRRVWEFSDSTGLGVLFCFSLLASHGARCA